MIYDCKNKYGKKNKVRTSKCDAASVCGSCQELAHVQEILKTSETTWSKDLACPKQWAYSNSIIHVEKPKRPYRHKVKEERNSGQRYASRETHNLEKFGVLKKHRFRDSDEASSYSHEPRAWTYPYNIFRSSTTSAGPFRVKDVDSQLCLYTENINPTNTITSEASEIEKNRANTPRAACQDEYDNFCLCKKEKRIFVEPKKFNTENVEPKPSTSEKPYEGHYSEEFYAKSTPPKEKPEEVSSCMRLRKSSSTDNYQYHAHRSNFKSTEDEKDITEHLTDSNSDYGDVSQSISVVDKKDDDASDRSPEVRPTPAQVPKIERSPIISKREISPEKKDINACCSCDDQAAAGANKPRPTIAENYPHPYIQRSPIVVEERPERRDSINTSTGYCALKQSGNRSNEPRRTLNEVADPADEINRSCDIPDQRPLHTYKLRKRRIEKSADVPENCPGRRSKHSTSTSCCSLKIAPSRSNKQPTTIDCHVQRSPRVSKREEKSERRGIDTAEITCSCKKQIPHDSWRETSADLHKKRSCIKDCGKKPESIEIHQVNAKPKCFGFRRPSFTKRGKVMKDEHESICRQPIPVNNCNLAENERDANIYRLNEKEVCIRKVKDKSSKKSKCCSKKKLKSKKLDDRRQQCYANSSYSTENEADPNISKPCVSQRETEIRSDRDFTRPTCYCGNQAPDQNVTREEIDRHNSKKICYCDKQVPTGLNEPKPISSSVDGPPREPDCRQNSAEGEIYQDNAPCCCLGIGRVSFTRSGKIIDRKLSTANNNCLAEYKTDPNVCGRSVSQHDKRVSKKSKHKTAKSKCCGKKRHNLEKSDRTYPCVEQPDRSQENKDLIQLVDCCCCGKQTSNKYENCTHPCHCVKHSTDANISPYVSQHDKVVDKKKEDIKLTSPVYDSCPIGNDTGFNNCKPYIEQRDKIKGRKEEDSNLTSPVYDSCPIGNYTDYNIHKPYVSQRVKVTDRKENDIGNLEKSSPPCTVQNVIYPNIYTPTCVKQLDEGIREKDKNIAQPICYCEKQAHSRRSKRREIGQTSCCGLQRGCKRTERKDMYRNKPVCYCEKHAPEQIPTRSEICKDVEETNCCCGIGLSRCGKAKARKGRYIVEPSCYCEKQALGQKSKRRDKKTSCCGICFSLCDEGVLRKGGDGVEPNCFCKKQELEQSERGKTSQQNENTSCCFGIERPSFMRRGKVIERKVEGTGNCEQPSPNCFCKKQELEQKSERRKISQENENTSCCFGIERPSFMKRGKVIERKAAGTGNCEQPSPGCGSCSEGNERDANIYRSPLLSQPDRTEQDKDQTGKEVEKNSPETKCSCRQKVERQSFHQPSDVNKETRYNNLHTNKRSKHHKTKGWICCTPRKKDSCPNREHDVTNDRSYRLRNQDRPISEKCRNEDTCILPSTTPPKNTKQIRVKCEKQESNIKRKTPARHLFPEETHNVDNKKEITPARVSKNAWNKLQNIYDTPCSSIVSVNRLKNPYSCNGCEKPRTVATVPRETSTSNLPVRSGCPCCIDEKCPHVCPCCTTKCLCDVNAMKTVPADGTEYTLCVVCRCCPVGRLDTENAASTNISDSSTTLLRGDTYNSTTNNDSLSNTDVKNGIETKDNGTSVDGKYNGLCNETCGDIDNGKGCNPVDKCAKDTCDQNNVDTRYMIYDKVSPNPFKNANISTTTDMKSSSYSTQQNDGTCYDKKRDRYKSGRERNAVHLEAKKPGKRNKGDLQYTTKSFRTRTIWRSADDLEQLLPVKSDSTQNRHHAVCSWINDSHFRSRTNISGDHDSTESYDILTDSVNTLTSDEMYNIAMPPMTQQTQQYNICLDPYVKTGFEYKYSPTSAQTNQSSNYHNAITPGMRWNTNFDVRHAQVFVSPQSGRVINLNKTVRENLNLDILRAPLPKPINVKKLPMDILDVYNNNQILNLYSNPLLNYKLTRSRDEQNGVACQKFKHANTADAAKIKGDSTCKIIGRTDVEKGTSTSCIGEKLVPINVMAKEKTVADMADRTEEMKCSLDEIDRAGKNCKKTLSVSTMTDIDPNRNKIYIAKPATQYINHQENIVTSSSDLSGRMTVQEMQNGSSEQQIYQVRNLSSFVLFETAAYAAMLRTPGEINMEMGNERNLSDPRLVANENDGSISAETSEENTVVVVNGICNSRSDSRNNSAGFSNVNSGIAIDTVKSESSLMKKLLKTSVPSLNARKSFPIIRGRVGDMPVVVKSSVDVLYRMPSFGSVSNSVDNLIIA